MAPPRTRSADEGQASSLRSAFGLSLKPAGPLPDSKLLTPRARTQLLCVAQKSLQPLAKLPTRPVRATCLVLPLSRSSRRPEDVLRCQHAPPRHALDCAARRTCAARDSRIPRLCLSRPPRHRDSSAARPRLFRRRTDVPPRRLPHGPQAQAPHARPALRAATARRPLAQRGSVEGFHHDPARHAHGPDHET